MIKILIVDPWCADNSNLLYYTTGLVGSLTKHCEVTFVSAYGLSGNINGCDIKRLFFKYSDRMDRGLFRTFVRGLEYIVTYVKILNLVRNEGFDIIQIEWPLLYRVDRYIFLVLKKYCKKFVLKAHNILPHSTGTKYLKSMRKLYEIADVILVHGERMKKEFGEYYPDLIGKICIQRHGVYVKQQQKYDLNDISNAVKERISSCRRIYLFFGGIHYDKGVDRLVKIWQLSSMQNDSLLVICGRVGNNYPNYCTCEMSIKECQNILYIPGYTPDNLLNYLVSNSNLVILPYRAGSMSGVVFTCANFAKPVLTTDFGTVEEYLENGIDSFVVENTDDKLREKLVEIKKSISNDQLMEMGNRLQKNITKKFDWKNIGEKLVKEVYC